MEVIVGPVQRLVSPSRAKKRRIFSGEQGEVGFATALHGFLPNLKLRTETPPLASNVSHTYIN